MKAKPDETLEEIWEIRRQIAKQFGYDPRKQVAYYQRKQKESGAKIYRLRFRLKPLCMRLTSCTTARTRKLPPTSASPLNVLPRCPQTQARKR